MCVVSQSQTSYYTTAAANRWDVALKLLLLAKCRILAAAHAQSHHNSEVTEQSRERTHHRVLGHIETKNVCYTGERASTTDHSMFKSIQCIIRSQQIASTVQSQTFQIYPTFKIYPATCLMQKSSPEGSFVYASDAPLITASHGQAGDCAFAILQERMVYFKTEFHKLRGHTWCSTLSSEYRMLEEFLLYHLSLFQGGALSPWAPLPVIRVITNGNGNMLES